MLQESESALVEAHDLVMLDLDGVVYVSGRAVEGVPDVLARVRQAETAIAFVTNNASRTARRVAEHLTELGVTAEVSDVVTSAQAAAGVLVQTYGTGASVLALGADGLVGALEEAGLVPVLDPSAEDVVAVVTGYGPEVVWKDVMQVGVRIRAGLPWVACNTDLTIPTDFGTAPGHGTLVRMLEDFTGVTPTVAGKPSRPLLDETVTRVGAESPLMVGDRLDTDIEGAAVAGVPSLLVLTGVTGLGELVAANGDERPSYISATLEGLFERHEVPRSTGDGASSQLGGWEAVVSDDDVLTVSGAGGTDDWWRVVATSAWRHSDLTGRVVRTEAVEPPS